MLTFDNFEYLFDCCKEYCTYKDFVNKSFDLFFYHKTYEAYVGMNMKELHRCVSLLANERTRDFLFDWLKYCECRREKEKDTLYEIIKAEGGAVDEFYERIKDYVPFNAFSLKKYIEDNPFKSSDDFEADMSKLLYLKCVYFPCRVPRSGVIAAEDYRLLRFSLSNIPNEWWEILIRKLQCMCTDCMDVKARKWFDSVIDGVRGHKCFIEDEKKKLEDISIVKLNDFLKHPYLGNAIDFCKENLSRIHFMEAYLCCNVEKARNYIFNNVILEKHYGFSSGFNFKEIIKAESDIRNIILKLGKDDEITSIMYDVMNRAFQKKIPIYFTIMRLFAVLYDRKRDCVNELSWLLDNYLLGERSYVAEDGSVCRTRVPNFFVGKHNSKADRLISKMFYNTMFLYVNEALGDYAMKSLQQTYNVDIAGNIESSDLDNSKIVKANIVTGLFEERHFTLNWHDVEFKKDIIVINPPEKNKSVKFVPKEVRLMGSKPSFNYLKDYFDIKMPDVSCTAYKMQLTIDSPISLEKAILDISKISKKYPAKKMQKSLVFVKTRDVECFSKAYDMGLTIDSSYLKKYNSAYIDYLITLHSKNYRVVPCLEVLAHSDNDVSEDSFFFTVEYTKNEEYLILIMENVNPNRATLLFLVRKESYIKDLNEIYDFMSGMEVNKRSTIKVNNARLKECGVVAFKAVNHGYLYEWQQAIRCW